MPYAFAIFRSAMLNAAQQVALAVVASLAADRAAAQLTYSRLSGYAALSTDYRNRGLSQTYGEPAAQLGLDYAHSSGWFAGAFLSNVEYAAQDDERDTELDVYGGYDWKLDDWALTAMLTRYAYPGAGSHYEEVSVGVRYRDRIYLTTSRTRGFVPGGLETPNHELTVSWPFDYEVELGATLGRSRIEGIPSSAYLHWNVGVSKLIGRVTVDVRYYDNDYEITTYIGDARPDQWVLSVSYALVGG
jgi:uncharacterized protein (TIGR02001 family)